MICSSLRVTASRSPGISTSTTSAPSAWILSSASSQARTIRSSPTTRGSKKTSRLPTPIRNPRHPSLRPLSTAFLYLHLFVPASKSSATTSNVAARSHTPFAMAPTESIDRATGTAPPMLNNPPPASVRPTVGLIPYNAALFPGKTIEPSVSAARASGAKPAETATAEPVDEPPGSRAGEYADFVWPPRGDHPLGIWPNSARKLDHTDMFVLPRIIMPALRNYLKVSGRRGVKVTGGVILALLRDGPPRRVHPPTQTYRRWYPFPNLDPWRCCP
jgi:hypothetical protein